ncbi:MAG: tRNA (adenosine(37)-N6)-threonylcarbamoyltransferase complex transferase subunit TsaD [Leptospiraceae bacterium]|nr:tRNA (adenosine(37)-N6)-threonylcarbamoyltransferase complex transferase subunit TsaD [Leptospiraceae bacterium]
MLGLGIESTCDETSLAIVRDGKEILALKVFSQTEFHAKYKGVVPELASRLHLEKINPILDTILKESKIALTDLSYVSVATHPGLIGSVMIGATLARTIGLCHSIPIVSVNHLEAHLHAVELENKPITYPYLGLLLSGGNTCIFHSKEVGELTKIADTMDDALGECLDKAANILGLGYPGGAEIERMANSFTNGLDSLFPKLLKEPREEILFSYSGLKTSVLYFTKKNPDYASRIPEICYHLQNAAFELVERNLLKAIEQTGIKTVIAGGGVLANDTLKSKLRNLSQKNHFQITYPEKKILCTDNGAMIASLGYALFQKGKTVTLDFSISPN